jgi:hypothetical protein
MDIKEMPDKEKVCTGGDLAEVLSRTRLSAEEAIAWKSDLEAAHKDSSATMTANEMVDYWSSIGSEMVQPTTSLISERISFKLSSILYRGQGQS